MRQAGEPSVEEILDSIKKVIARDGRAAVDEEKRMVNNAIGDALVEPLRPRHEPEMVPETALELADDDVLDLAEAAPFAAEGPADGESAAPLLAENAVNSMRESLAALATMAAPGAAPQIVRSGETSLEGLVREMLRPMLAEWLDTHLPATVERMVSAEIARIVGKKG